MALVRREGVIIEEPSQPGTPAWMVTFCDLMTLLLTMFVVVVSMSEARPGSRYQLAADAIRREFGWKGQSSTNAMPPAAANSNSDNAKPHPAQEPVLAVQPEKSREAVPVRNKLVPACTVFFADDSAELGTQGRKLLDRWVQRALNRPELIELRGHTIPEPPGAQSSYRDNWDLASARADAVRNYLTTLKVDPRRLRMTSAAGYEPIFPGSTPSEHRRNNRVEVYVLDELASRPDRHGTSPR